MNRKNSTVLLNLEQFSLKQIKGKDLFLYGGIALLILLGVCWPPYSAAAVIGVVFGGFLLLLRPDLVFILFFAVETLISEDILLITEKLDVTLYRVNLPFIGLNIFEVVLLLLIAVTAIQRGFRFSRTRLDFTLGLFGLAATLGYATCIILTQDLFRLFEPRRLLHFFAAFFLTVNLFRKPETIRTFFLIYFIAVAAKAVEGVFLYTAGEGLQIKWQIRAIFTGWEDSLSFMTYLLFLGVFLLDREWFPLKRGFLLFSPAVVFGFLFSYKRAYYVAMAVGLLCIFGMLKSKARLRFFALLIILAVILAGVITFADQWKAIGMRLESIMHPTQESSANYRLVEWQNAVLSIYRHPIFGIGLGGVMPMEIFLERTNLLGVHNTFLWVAVKMGIFGFFSYVLLHCVFLRHLHRQNQRLRDPFLHTLSRALFCVFIAYTAAEMFAPMFAQMRTGTWLGVMLGIGIRLQEIDIHQKKSA